MSYQIHYTVVYDSSSGEFFLTDTVPPYSDQPVWDKITKAWRSVDEIVENALDGDDFESMDIRAEQVIRESLRTASI